MFLLALRGGMRSTTGRSLFLLLATWSQLQTIHAQIPINTPTSTSPSFASTKAPPSASSASSVSSAPSGTSSTPVIDETPSLQFVALPTVTACGTARITWSYSGTNLADYNITLQIRNVGVDQTIPPASSSASSSTTDTPLSGARTSGGVGVSGAGTSGAPSSAAPSVAAFADISKRFINITQTLVTQTASVGYTMTVKVPQGQYFIAGILDDPFKTAANSPVFTVLEQGDVSCLGALGSLAHSSTASTPTSTPATSAAATDGTLGSSHGGGGGLTGGAIAGIVIGAIAAIVAIVLLIFFLSRRRRQKAANERAEPGMKSRPRSRSGSFGHRLGTMVVGGNGGDSDRRHQRERHIALTSMGDGSTEGHEKEETTARNSDSDAGTPIYLAHARHSLDTPANKPPAPRLTDPFTTAPNTPQGLNQSKIDSHSTAPTSTAARRRSGPPLRSPTVPEPLPGLHDEQVFRARSNSQPSDGVSGPGASGLGRTPSSRRKPVPSLGPELRGELNRDTSQKSRRHSASISRDEPMSNSTEGAGAGGKKEMSRASGTFQLIPDPPRVIDE